MRELRAAPRNLLPAPLRERYHEHAVRRDSLENGDEACRLGEAARVRIAERYSPAVIRSQIASRLAQVREGLKATA